MAFLPNKLAVWLVFAFLLGVKCPFFAQTASPDRNAGNLFYALESLLGQPNEEVLRHFTRHNISSETLLAKAEAHILSFKNDSAILVSNLMFHTLRRQNQLDSPFGLKVQLVLARALEHNDADSISVRLLLHVKESCQQEGPWDTYAKCCLAIALWEENRSRPDQCLEYLNLAKSAIDRHDLKALYPSYAMRACSYNRYVVKNRDTAIYYAKEVLRTAPGQNMVLEEAWGHLLLAWLLYQHDGTKYLEHLHAAATLFVKIEDYTGLSYAFRDIAGQYFRAGDLNKVMIYNDSCIIAAQKSVIQGNKWNAELFNAYRFRADLFRQLERHDSAWYYLTKSYEVELDFARTKEVAKVAEIDARYLNEKKTKQIQEQAETIDEEQREGRWLLLIIGIMLLFAAGLVAGLVKYIRERRLLAQKNILIQQQATQLQSLDIAKSRFFANVSHELRTPLTLLTSPLQTLLKENHLTEKQTMLLQMAERSGKQLRQLINEILDLRKLEMGKMTLATEPTALRTWFQAYFAQFESLAGQRQVNYKVTLHIPEHTIADLDQEKCRQVLFNLLSNAFKFTPQGGHIEARIQVSDQQLQIHVANSGPGIHPDDLPHVFDRYFQSIRPDKPAEGGTGIGLALCHEYAHLFGGAISVESKPGADTVFRVTFPLLNSRVGAEDVALLATPTLMAAPESVEIMPVFSATPPKAAANQASILLVEDNPDLRDYIRLVLQDKYKVITAEHGQAALSLINNTPGEMTKNNPDQTFTTPDLILTDMMMPVMDGYQLLEKLKSDDTTRHIPVIVLSARAEVQDKLKALRIGVDDYLTKPFDEEELLVRIENLLKNQAARQDAATDTAIEAAPAILLSGDAAWLEKFEAFVRKNLSNDTLTVPVLAFEFAMSESTLLRQLKRLTGLSTVLYLQEIRLDEARRLLDNRSNDSIAQIASQVGYSEVRSFSRIFKQRFGKSPSDYIDH